jgi:hypothetical protein
MTSHTELWAEQTVKLPRCRQYTHSPPKAIYAGVAVRRPSMKITSEKVGDSLKVKLGPRVYWLGAASAILVVLILFGVGIIPAFDRLRLAINSGGSIGGYILGIVFCSGLVLLIFLRLPANLFRTEVVTVSHKELQIEWLVCGYVRSQRAFQIQLSKNSGMSDGRVGREETGCIAESALTALERR